ncbi:hypothetical protein P879_01108 [Paragonimus westermani]|uniref:Serpin domain-containing protein n=1 Tax=Paragonimus westermani TaxID=34504 RepID=A0A8T0DT76_9TREM|nr:hypothetical protein P879_01108 [Paragonimus westermani]
MLMERHVAEFTEQFYGEIIDQERGDHHNAFASPLSLFVTMIMMWIGSGGNTRREIASALTFPESLNKYSILTATRDLSDVLTDSTNIDVSFANRVYTLNNLQVRWQFVCELRNYLNGDLIQFPDDVHYEKSRMEVNKWVEEQTRGIVRELLPAGSNDDETRMIAVNALYFKGIWKEQFSDSQTYEASFHRLDGTRQKIKMMYLKHRFDFHQFRWLDAHAIRIPFSDALWEMVIVLPNKRNGLPKLLEHIRQSGVLRNITSSSYRTEEISLHLPRFQLGLAGSVNVTMILNRMGIRDLFSSQSANLSGITEQGPLVVSNVFHKAVLKVDEKGATAAAATAAVIGLRSASFTPNFVVDHPFLVMLVYNKTVPAFVGHCVQPEPN